MCWTLNHLLNIIAQCHFTISFSNLSLHSCNTIRIGLNIGNAQFCGGCLQFWTHSFSLNLSLLPKTCNGDGENLLPAFHLGWGFWKSLVVFCNIPSLRYIAWKLWIFRGLPSILQYAVCQSRCVTSYDV